MLSTQSLSGRMFNSVGAMTLLAMLALVSTGCMTSPHNHEVIGKTGDTFDAEGFLLDPGTPITFQYYHFGVNQWKVLAVGTSGNWALKYDGLDWYYWSTKGLKVPPGGWSPGGLGGTMWARVRAVSSADGQPVATFRKSLIGVWDDTKSLDQLWAEAGYGNEVRILAYP